MTVGGAPRREGRAVGCSDSGALKGARGSRARGVCFSSILRSVVATATFRLFAAFATDLREVSGRPLCAGPRPSGTLNPRWLSQATEETSPSPVYGAALLMRLGF